MRLPPPPNVELLPFDPGRDLATVRTWLHRPHVARWWGDPDIALAAVELHPTTAHALIAADKTAVGYLCWQVPSPEELAAAGLSDVPGDLMDIDVLIGELGYLGHGVGPRALSLLLDRLQAEGCSQAGIAAAVANPRALRAYEKAGFRPFRMFREGGEDYWYLIQALTASG